MSEDNKISRSSLREKLYVVNEYGIEHQNPLAVLTEEEIAFAKKEWNIRTDLHRTCINCQIRHMLKYENRIVDNKPVKKFTVPCLGIAASLPKGSSELLENMIAKGMKKERALLILQSAVDPVAWAELIFGFSDDRKEWHLRSYQKEQLRCSSQRIVIREGRRSGKTFIIALKLLWMIFNKTMPRGLNAEGEEVLGAPEIMVVTPFQAQLTNIFDEFERLIKRNNFIKASVTTGSAGSLYVKTPTYRMEFENGGVIKGFVSGVGVKTDGSAGGTMRGQSANVIYLDEMDMIPESTLEKVVMPILLTDPNGDVCLIATSTPIGKRARFYDLCLNDPTFKEDYLPSSVLPQWAANKELIIGKADRETVMSEYMAAFIDSDHGVFKPSYVYRSMGDYSYEELASKEWWTRNYSITSSDQIIRCIGIDWNKNAGTEYVVVTYVPHAHVYYVSDVVNISSGEFSAARWREELIRLNYKWRPDYIYADDGYGQTIIEDLRVISANIQAKPNKNLQDIETAKLDSRLKSIFFSQKITLRNPVDGTLMEKPAKEFLVENTKRILEETKNGDQPIFFFSNEDEQLKDELLHYIVERRNKSNNKPVYGTDNDKIGDHRLDALMLALAGIQIEAGIYAETNTLLSAPAYVPPSIQESKNIKQQFNEYLDKITTTDTVRLTSLNIIRSGDTAEHAQARGDRGFTGGRRSITEEADDNMYEYYKKKFETNGNPGRDRSIDKPDSNPFIIKREGRGSRRK